VTRFIHDQFAKDYLEELLTPYGTIQSPRRVSGEVRQVDLWFAPNPESTLSPKPLGILAQAIQTPAVFEPFRNPATADEICDCLLKLLVLRGELQREINRTQRTIPEERRPKLWILTPTASSPLLAGFGATLDLENWPNGIYVLPPLLRTVLVAIHQLPRSLDTLWLRVLGRGRVQQQAIDELEALAPENPFRTNALTLLNRLKADLQATQNLNTEDRELIMRLSPLFDQQLEAAKLSGLQQGVQQGREQGLQQGLQEGLQQGLQEGLQQGLQEGLQQGERLVLENLLRVRFGTVDEDLAGIIDAVLSLPPEEFTPLVMQLSREDLIARFRGN
jgi:hypothetical protein